MLHFELSLIMLLLLFCSYAFGSMLVVPLYILVMRHWLLSQDLSLREMYVELLATISIIGSIIGQEVVMLLPAMMI